MVTSTSGPRDASPFVALLRGINVGGKNLIAMTDVAEVFRAAGYGEVGTYGQSGNVLFDAGPVGRASLESSIGETLGDRFGAPVLVVVRSREELAATVAGAPADFGSDRLRSEVFFVGSALTAEAVFAQLPALRDGVDRVSLGPGALYFSRVAARATKTRIQLLMAMPVFQQMTVRSWRVTTRLAGLLDERAAMH